VRSMGILSWKRGPASLRLGVSMRDLQRVDGVADGFVDFRSTGDAVKGEFHCAECGYGVTVYRELPRCPMCGGTTWEQAPWSPFTRAAAGDLPLQ
jgi:rubredoxin